MAILKIIFASENLLCRRLPVGLLLNGVLELEGGAQNVAGDDPYEAHSAVVSRLIQVPYWGWKYSIVYRAVLDETVDVILKIGVYAPARAKLETEADNYQMHLREFWGSVVPTFYGLYKARSQQSDIRNNEVSCLVLEYAGEPLENPELPQEERRKILETLGALHLQAKLRIRHFDLQHVVQNNGVYRLIDFERLTLHDCEFNGDWQWHKRYSADVGCPYLRVEGQDMGAWNPKPEPTVLIGRTALNADRYPSQKFIDAMCEPYMMAAFNKMHFIGWMRDVRKYMDEYGIPVEDDHEDEDLKGYAEEIQPTMPLSWAEANSITRKDPSDW